ncbi:MAG: alpha-ribazole phosphatase family protein [Pseudomonadota bacterium]
MLIGRSRRRASRDTSTSLRVGLLRHGEVEGGSRFRGHTDDPLTATGLAHMHAAIADSGNWEHVVSSPLARCAAFAKEYARRYSSQLSFDARMMEMHFGAWEDRTAAELMTTNADALTRFWNDPLHNTPPGGEPLSQFQARVLDAWKDIVAGHAGQRVLIVTHGGVIRVLLCQVTGVSVAQLQEFSIGHGQLHSMHIDRDGSVRLDGVTYVME